MIQSWSIDIFLDNGSPIHFELPKGSSFNSVEDIIKDILSVQYPIIDCEVDGHTLFTAINREKILKIEIMEVESEC